MTLSRFDLSPNLYSPWNNTPRAFWHPGIGLWQLDILFPSLSAFKRIKVDAAANKVAQRMADDYCDASGGAVARRRVAFSRYNACGSQATVCENIYQDIYCSGSDSVCHMNTDPTVTRKGGMKQRTCYYGNVPPFERVYFTCWFIDPDNAEGWTGSWQQTPKAGDDSISPLAFAFYNYAGSGAIFEYRHWLEADTGYNRGEVWASRDKGNPRDSGALDWMDSDVLCDSDVGKGTC